MGDEAMEGRRCDENRSRMIMGEDVKNCTVVAEACWRSDVAPLRSERASAAHLA
jgi:hypothetical protein